MPVDSVSSVSSSDQAAALSQMRRNAETAPDAREEATREENASASTGTRASAASTTNDTEQAVRQSSAEISRAYSSGETSPSDMRAASEAYRAEATARDQQAQQQQGNGTRITDVLA